MSSRYGRRLQQPQRYHDEDIVSDATDTDESTEMPDSITSDSTGSLDDFIVETDAEEEDDDATGELIDFVLFLCEGAEQPDIDSLMQAITSGEFRQKAELRGILKDHIHSPPPQTPSGTQQHQT